jgi:hypothetical protein
MFRKLAFAIGASAVIGAAALTPTTASAHWLGHGHWHGGSLVAPATVFASLAVSGNLLCLSRKQARPPS